MVAGVALGVGLALEVHIRSKRDLVAVGLRWRDDGGRCWCGRSRLDHGKGFGWGGTWLHLPVEQDLLELPESFHFTWGKG